MANSTAEIPLAGIGQEGKRFHLPVKTAQAIFAGNLVSQQTTDGLLVPTTATGAGRAIGKAVQTIASAAAGERCLIESGRTYLFTNGATTDAFSEASQRGAPAYALDDHTIADNSNGDTLPFVGFYEGMEADGKVRVFVIGYDITGVDVAEAASGGITAVRARNVVNANVANLAAYTVASNAANNDATLGVAGDIVLLVAQTTAAENGLYTIGTVAAGAAPLVRHPSMFTARVFRTSEFDVAIGSGTVFAHSRWFNSLAGTVGTDASGFVPESVTISQALIAGTMTLISVPILSATKTAISAYRKTANTSTGTTGGYVTNGTATAGALGTASVEVMAAAAAGTINNADISTLHVTITNR